MADNVFVDELEDSDPPVQAKTVKGGARVSREGTERAMHARPTSWAPPELLPEITWEAGYVYRWIRAETHGQDDAKNMSAKAREGWEPVAAEEQPRAAKYFGGNKKRGMDTIEFGGLVLCKRPKEFNEQRHAYYQSKTAEQTRAVDQNLMKQNDSRMPLFRDSRTTVSVGTN